MGMNGQRSGALHTYLQEVEKAEIEAAPVRHHWSVVAAARLTGVITGRDALLTDLDRRTFETRLVELRGDPRIAPEHGTVPGFSSACLRRLRQDPDRRRRIVPFLVRPETGRNGGGRASCT
jgi:hypothetical protein